jgi:tetratricopeptide (TPR) repeat protein
MAAEVANLQQQLDRETARLSSASTAADKAKYKASIDGIQSQVDALKEKLTKADVEIDRAFDAYNKLLALRPDDRGIINEMAVNYYAYRRYNQAARMWGKLIDPAKNNPDEYMQVGRAYYNGENYKSADSVFNVILQKNPDYVPAYTWIARSYSKMDPDLKLGLAKPKFEKMVSVAQKDSVKNATDIMEGLNYLSYYHMMKKDYEKARAYFDRMINLDPNNKDYKIRGYLGLAQIESAQAGDEKVKDIENKIAYLARANEYYQKVLALDPANPSVKASQKCVQEYIASLKKGINPNEIRGMIKIAAGQPIPYASIRVKNTAAEQLSNTKGEFKFEIPQGSEILVVSAEGYKPKEVAITKSRNYTVVLDK